MLANLGHCFEVSFHFNEDVEDFCTSIMVDEVRLRNFAIPNLNNPPP